MTYDAARKAFLAAGWQPLQTRSADDPAVAYGNGPGFWKKGYTEVETCSGTGLAFCEFLFKDAFGNRLRVVTAGEEAPEDKSAAMISHTEFVCD
ncbi:MAG: hypothetical protein JO010_03735 [Alphaproteobacteria bacterium]|nr:hypothetical protein [Alphaproteobacteria bacterium]